MARWCREAFPPHAVLVRQSDVGEYRVFRQRVHRVWVGLPGGTRRDAEESGLGVDRMEFARLAGPEPSDIVSDEGGFPAGF